MAKAGFYYTPTDDSEDMVNCPYCLIGLDGWEPKDDPLYVKHTRSRLTMCRKEHKSRTPTCPFFVGLHSSLPASNASSPVKSVVSEPTTTTRSLRNSAIELDDHPTPPSKQPQNKRRIKRQSTVEDDDPEIFSSVESPPPSKRRKSTRAPSESTQTTKPPPPPVVDPAPTVRHTPSKRKSGRVTSNSRKPRKSTVNIDSATETTDEIDPTPVSNRRVTRSGLTLPPLEDDAVETQDVSKDKAPVKSKGKHARTKSRNVSALSRIVSEIDKTPSRRATRTTQTVETVDPTPEPLVEEQEEIPRKKRGRLVKAPDVDEEEDTLATIPPKTTTRRTRQSTAPETVDVDDEPSEQEVTAKQPKALVVPKRKRASTRTTRTVSAAPVEELPDIEESEPEVIPNPHTRTSGRVPPVIENPDTKGEEESEPADPEPEEPLPAPPRRGRKPTRGRAKSTNTVRNSTISNPPEDPLPAPSKPTRGGARTVSKRNISAVYPEPEVTSPPAKRKASGLRSVQKLPTPSSEEGISSDEDDVFEDSKSIFSDIDDIPVRGTKSSRRGRGKTTTQLRTSRSRPLTSEERETEDGAPSTIYHSADDYQSSPTQSSSGVTGKSKREMVDNAKKELQEEIWREKVANGEIGMGGSSEDDEKENAAEEKGKKPTRTVRGKGSKGRGGAKAKSNGKKRGKLVTQAEVSEEDDPDDGDQSIGESHALVVKAMISPLRPGPLVPVPSEDEEDRTSDASSAAAAEDRLVPIVNGHVTPVQSPKRKVLNWTPAKIEEVVSAPVPNGVLAEEEEDMTVEQWMRWVINDEVNRLEEECEKLVRNLEREGDRARRLLENLV